MNEKEKTKSWQRAEIVIPIYKQKLTEEEQFAVDRTFKILGHYPITFFGPQGLLVDYYVERYSLARFKFFRKNFFESVQSYSRLLVSSEFYRAFEVNEFVLLVQPDVYIFKDDLITWLDKGYDYVAAPWPSGIAININFGKFTNSGRGGMYTAYVGNGGFSLRRVKRCQELIEEHGDVADWFAQTGSNEDLFFSFMGGLSGDFNIPNLITASYFGMELEPERLWQLNGQRLPMGAHAYNQYSPEFWRKFIEKPKSTTRN
jgi:hypothetical protein